MINNGNSFQAVLRVLFDMQIYSGKSYTWMSRTEIRKRLLKFHGVNICLSTIDYHLDNIAKSGLARYFRKKAGRNPDGTVFVRPPNRSITLAGVYWLKKKGIAVAGWLLDHLKGKIKIKRGKGPDSPSPQNNYVQKNTNTPTFLNKFVKAIGNALF